MEDLVVSLLSFCRFVGDFVCIVFLGLIEAPGIFILCLVNEKRSDDGGFVTFPI
jgi:hypothetical protein